ncbi:MAG TPA: transglutaminase-like domain-containing protein [Planctomycetota bacterium]|nr:transglutaminase-like domain-containing protein [Planctomycetota bacterium]
MNRRRATTSHLGAAACIGLFLSGAATPLVPLACLLILFADIAWLAPRGWRPRPLVLLALQIVVLVPFAYLVLFKTPEVDFLRLLLVAAAPLIVLRSLHEETDFNDFLIILLSLLVVVGSAALAPGAMPILITAVYVLVGCQALRVLAAGRGTSAAAVRFRLERPLGWWAVAPALASHHLALGGLLLGGLFYLVAPQPGTPPDEGPGRGGRLLAATDARDTGSRTSAEKGDFPRDVRLGDLGRMKRRSLPALEVELRAKGRPYDPREGERSMLLLRARAWERFSPAARRWELPRARARQLSATGILEQGEAELDWTVDVLGYDGRTLFLPQRARRVRAAGGALSIDRLGVLTSPVPVTQYSVASARPVAPGDLESLVPDMGNAELLQVPDPSARVLMPQLPRLPRRSLRGAVVAVAEYFASNGYAYTLELPPEIDNADDPLAAFLAHHEGDCEMYATTACLMLRLLGVPARVAGGLRLSERLGPGRYLARLSNAHAWVEVPCRGVGFVALDFTPPDSAAKAKAAEADAPGGGEEAGGPGGQGAAGLLDWRDPFAYGPEERERVLLWLEEHVVGWPLAALVLGVLLLLGVPPLVAAIRRRPRSPLGITAPKGGSRTTLAFYAQWLRACAAKGFVRARVQTPREFLAALPPELREGGIAITEEFERRRYGP